MTIPPMPDRLVSRFSLEFDNLLPASREDEAELAAFRQRLSAMTLIDSQASFNRFCRQACVLWADAVSTDEGPAGVRFSDLARDLDAGGDHVIPTSWGGVVIRVHEHPRVEKYLVVRRGGYLALETHRQKTEELRIEDGSGLLLTGRAGGDVLSVLLLEPGMSFTFHPGEVHCLIGTDNLLVFEQSSDPEGMDQDLVFIYTPEA